jgi:hypothetical protein
MDESAPGLQELGPLGRLAVAVAGQALTGYLQMQALAELLISRGIITREEWQAHYHLLLAHELETTIEAWFPPDIAEQLKQTLREQGPWTDEGSRSP